MAEIVAFNWKPDRKLPDSLQAQITNFLLKQIKSGLLSPGSRLPSQRNLASQFGVNRSTIGVVLGELQANGLIESNGSAGTRIVKDAWQLLLQDAPTWMQFESNSAFIKNQPIIQTINKLEFDADLMRLGTGELDPRLTPKEMISKSLSHVSKNLQMGYLPPLGLLELRQEVANHFSELRVDADNVLITSGSLQGLHLIANGLLPKDAVMLTENPSYIASVNTFQSAGVRLVPVSMDNEGLMISELSKTKGNILYTIPTNQNPTGITMSLDRRRSLLRYCSENQLPIIEDTAYQELSFGESVKSLKELDSGETVLQIGTVSKTLLPGLRIGWIIGPKPVVNRLGDIKMQIDYGASSLSQWLMTDLFSSGAYSQYMVNLRTVLQQRMKFAMTCLEHELGDVVTWTKPIGGFYIWLNLPKKVSVLNVFRKLIKQKVLINPGDVYSNRKTHSVRLSYAYLNEQELEVCIHRLANVVKEEL